MRRSPELYEELTATHLRVRGPSLPRHESPPLRVAIVTESFLPHVNGVTNTVLRVLEHLAQERHHAIVLAPGKAEDLPRSHAGFPVVRVPSLPLPGYRQVRLGLANRVRITEELAGFSPDVVHLASPFVLGAVAASAAQAMGVPSVAVYQTDIPGFASRYRLHVATDVMWNHIHRIHQKSALTLAPSSAASQDLREHNIGNVKLWARGVDSQKFHPERFDQAWRAKVAPHGQVIVGYVGRLAREKNIHLLQRLANKPGIRLVIIGEGPYRKTLERLMPAAVFLGLQTGMNLAQAMASLDVLVHPGEHETFCQVIQEGMASAVPVVAPASGGPLDLVEPGVTGLLYTPGDQGSLEQAVMQLVSDPERRKIFGRAGRLAVEKRDWTSVCASLVRFYRDVVKK